MSLVIIKIETIIILFNSSYVIKWKQSLDKLLSNFSKNAK